MKRPSLFAAYVSLGFTGAACAQSADVAASGPYNPAPPQQAADLQTRAPCMPDTTLPNQVVTKPRSGELSGGPRIQDAGNRTTQLAQMECPGVAAAPVQPNNIPPYRQP